jgi:hypothetical protein
MSPQSYYLPAGFAGRRAGAGMIHLTVEIFRIGARAWTAAHDYEALKRLSGPDLAERGLRRADLPRAVFHLLTDTQPTGARCSAKER